MNRKPHYRIVGDRGVSVEFGNEISEDINNLVRGLASALGKANLPGIIETYPTFSSLFIFYNPLEIKTSALIIELRKLQNQIFDNPTSKARTFEIPVVYGGEYGVDLDDVARLLTLTTEEIVKIHSSGDYLVYMNGAYGGTAYIKMPDPLSSVPRKKTPSLRVPEGSVMIAGGVGCAFKAVDGPAGWNVLGRTFLKQWYPRKDPPLRILSGDRVRFVPITEKEYHELKKHIQD